MKAVKSIKCGNFVVRSNEYYSVATAAKKLKMSPKTLRQLINSKQIKALPPHRHYRVPGKSIIKYYESFTKG